MSQHAVILGLMLFSVAVVADDNVPLTVAELWDDVDVESEPLEVHVVRQWDEDDIRLQYVLYRIGSFKGQQATMAAFFGFPKNAEKLPGLLHLHGGGQRAFLHEVRYYARRGYACLSINWGGREMETAKPTDPNTDWGAVDPTQKNVPGYGNLKPGTLYLDPFESPRNNNWFLLTYGARRGLTFLENQPQVDKQRLGVYGHSMGGNLTMYVAGTDNRIKVAAPSVGGQGFRTFPLPLLPEQSPRRINGDVGLFRATLGFQSYAPRVTAPLLWLSGTNDFHQFMDDTYRTAELMPGKVRFSFAPHLNHRFTDAFAVTRPLWLDEHLKGSFRFPESPNSKLTLAGEGGIPRLEIKPDLSKNIDRVELFYSIDPDPQARFWRTAKATSMPGNIWSAPLPVLSKELPLFAFANVHYKLTKPQAIQFSKPAETFAISSKLHTASSDELKTNQVKATDKPSRLIDDFSNGFRDWYLLSENNPHHWQYWTRKINDPKWRGPKNSQLAFEIKTAKPNAMVVMITENFFRSYRGKKREWLAEIVLPGGADWHPVTLRPSKFKSLDGKKSLGSWDHADLLGFRAFLQVGDQVRGTRKWSGVQPELRQLRWSD